MFETTRQVCREHDPRALEYFPQACGLKFELMDAADEIHSCMGAGGSL